MGAVRDLSWSMRREEDIVIYRNHLQLARTPRDLPRIEINPAVRSIFQFKYEDFSLVGYDPHPHIKAQVAV